MDPEVQLTLKTRDMALVLLGVLLDRSGLQKSLRCLPAGRREELELAAAPLLAMPGKQRINLALARLKNFLDPDHQEQLEEIHPQWLADYLQHQPVLLAGLVLKSLSPEFLPKVAAELEPRTLERIKQQLHGITSSAEQQGIFQAILRRHFQLPNPPAGTGREPFSALFFLNCAELAQLVEELGSAELAMACQNLPAKDFDQICRKLTPRIKEKIQLKMAQYAQTPPEEILKARQSFLHLKDELYEKGRMIEFTGTHILAASMAGATPGRVRFLAYKLPLRQGTLFLKLVQRIEPGGSGEELTALRKKIVEKIVYLAEIDRIRSLWKYI